MGKLKYFFIEKQLYFNNYHPKDFTDLLNIYFDIPMNFISFALRLS